jgi:hypothetical protein
LNEATVLRLNEAKQKKKLISVAIDRYIMKVINLSKSTLSLVAVICFKIEKRSKLILSRVILFSSN